MSRPPAASVEEVVDLYRTWADHPYDEEVTQLTHALQTASRARRDGADDALVVAALLHDVGHLFELAGGNPDPSAQDLRHEASGARWLASVFAPEVTGPIALHVAAKRYLCATDPTYGDGLSAGSQASLARQGGPMTDAEVERFERLPASAAAVRLRRWDDLGKDLDRPDVGCLDDYCELLHAMSPKS